MTVKKTKYTCETCKYYPYYDCMGSPQCEYADMPPCDEVVGG